jgi:hypothetical protein
MAADVITACIDETVLSGSSNNVVGLLEPSMLDVGQKVCAVSRRYLSMSSLNCTI